LCHASFAKVAIAGKLGGSMAKLGNMLSGNSANCTIVVGKNLIWSIIISPHKMSNEKHSGGRPPAKILTDNFTELEKVDNKSRRKFWKCNYCTATTGNGQHIEGRDNRCLLHLTNPKDCPDALQFVRNEARKALMQKGTVIGQTEMPLSRMQLLSMALNQTVILDQVPQQVVLWQSRNESRVGHWIIMWIVVCSDVHGPASGQKPSRASPKWAGPSRAKVVACSGLASGFGSQSQAFKPRL
jgi:hypothetical protein